MYALPKYLVSALLGVLVVFSIAVYVREATLRSDATMSRAYRPALSWEALHYSKLAYCPPEEIINWTCGETCASEALQPLRLHRLIENETAGTLGYTAVDHQRRRIVVAFRGSKNLANWLDNLSFLSTAYRNPACTGNCTVHRGFYSAYESLQAEVRAAVLELRRAHPKYHLLVSGHSLGGALALLAAADLLTWQPLSINLAAPHNQQSDVALPEGEAPPPPLPPVPLLLYTFGAPRVGNAAFAAWAAQILPVGRQFRLTRGQDPVPHLPPQSCGYLHLPQEVWYYHNRTSGESNTSSSGSGGRNDSEKEFFLCGDTVEAEDATCSNSVWSTSLSDHLRYMGVTTRCRENAELEEQEEEELLWKDVRLTDP